MNAAMPPVSRCSVVRPVGVASYDTNAPDGDWHRTSRIVTANHHEFYVAGRCKFCGLTIREATDDDA